MSKRKSIIKIVVTLFGLVGFGILAVGSGDSKSSKSSSPENSAASAPPAETKAPVTPPVNINLSDPKAIFGGAIDIDEDKVAPIWGDIPGKDEFEKNKNTSQMPELKRQIKAWIYRVDLDYDVGEYNFSKKHIPIKISWPHGPWDFIISDFRPEIKSKMLPEGDVSEFATRPDIIYSNIFQKYADKTTGKPYEKSFFISEGKKLLLLKETNLDKAKQIKEDVNKVVLTFKVISGWKSNLMNDSENKGVGEAHGVVINPLFIYVLGSNDVIYQTLVWPK